MECPKCQHENAEGQKFCDECGSALISVCGKCGNANPPQLNFCGEWRIRLRVAIPALDEALASAQGMTNGSSK